MCSVCGCGSDEARIDGKSATHDHHHHHHHHHEDGEGSAQHHHHHHAHSHDHQAHPHAEPAAGEGGESRLLRIEQDILAKNDGFAAENRARLQAAGTLALNLVSSPGAGKTTLLTATIAALDAQGGGTGIVVIEGDQETANDAERIRATGVPAVQINTGRGCHLDAHMVGHALDGLTLGEGSVLFIENVGNLVCPAAFDLGEHHKVAILSVTEGEDKPIKYPDMFAAADLMVLNKIDLLPHVDFDVERCVDYARRVNPEIRVVRLSARSGEGMAAWVAWIEEARRRAGRNADQGTGCGAGIASLPVAGAARHA